MNLAEARNGAAKFGHQRREAIRRRVRELQTLEETKQQEMAQRVEQPAVVPVITGPPGPVDHSEPKGRS